MLRDYVVFGNCPARCKLYSRALPSSNFEDVYLYLDRKDQDLGMVDAAAEVIRK